MDYNYSEFWGEPRRFRNIRADCRDLLRSSESWEPQSATHVPLEEPSTASIADKVHRSKL